MSLSPAKSQAVGADLTALINKHGLDQDANVPDYIIAQYLMWSLAALNRTIFLRDGWFGRFENLPTTEGEAKNG